MGEVPFLCQAVPCASAVAGIPWLPGEQNSFTAEIQGWNNGSELEEAEQSHWHGWGCLAWLWLPWMCLSGAHGPGHETWQGFVALATPAGL